MTSYLCELTGVSRSGYYKWLHHTEKQVIREERDYQDYLLLKSIYDEAKGKIGYRGLYMALVELLDKPMNHRRFFD